MIIESIAALSALGVVGNRLLCGPSPKSLPVKNEDQEMFGLSGGGKKAQVAPVQNSQEGLWAFQNNVHSAAIANGHKVKLGLRSFDSNGNPFIMTSEFN